MIRSETFVVTERTVCDASSTVAQLRNEFLVVVHAKVIAGSNQLVERLQSVASRCSVGVIFIVAIVRFVHVLIRHEGLTLIAQQNVVDVWREDGMCILLRIAVVILARRVFVHKRFGDLALIVVHHHIGRSILAD